VASNAVFAVAFVIFSRQINGTPETLLLPNGLLVIGLGLRWRAVRTFFGRPTSSAWFVAMSLVMALGLLLSRLVGNGLVFGLTNAIIAAQIGAIMVALALERERLPSRWGWCSLTGQSPPHRFCGSSRAFCLATAWTACCRRTSSSTSI
jgi:hypothetical protein